MLLIKDPIFLEDTAIDDSKSFESFSKTKIVGNIPGQKY